MSLQATGHRQLEGLDIHLTRVDMERLTPKILGSNATPTATGSVLMESQLRTSVMRLA